MQDLKMQDTKMQDKPLNSVIALKEKSDWNRSQPACLLVVRRQRRWSDMFVVCSWMLWSCPAESWRVLTRWLTVPCAVGRGVEHDCVSGCHHHSTTSGAEHGHWRLATDRPSHSSTVWNTSLYYVYNQFTFFSPALSTHNRSPVCWDIPQEVKNAGKIRGFQDPALQYNVLTAIFPGEPGFASVYWSKKVVVKTGATRRAKLQSNCHHKQTNIQLFTGALPVAQPTVSEHRRECGSLYEVNEKALREVQTLRAGCSKTEPKIFTPPKTPSQGRGTAKI